MDEVKTSRSDKFFNSLFRFNAVLMLVVLLLAAIWMMFGLVSDYQYRSSYGPGKPSFGHTKAKRESDYEAMEYETPDGPVHVYNYGDEPDMDSGMVSSGMTIVHAQSGRQLRIIPEGNELVLASFDIIDNEVDQAVAFLARISTPEDYAKGRARLVVGSLTAFKQVEIAENAPYLDAQVLAANNRLALVYWPDDTSARMVSIDLSNLSIERAEEIDLPPPKTLKPLKSPRSKRATAVAPEALWR